MKALYQPFEEMEAFRKAKEALDRNEWPLNLSGVIESQKCHLIKMLSDHKHKVVIARNDVMAREIVEDMQYFSEEDVFLYPSKDIIFYSADVHSNDIVEERMRVIKRLWEGAPAVVVLAVDTLFEKLVPSSDIFRNILFFEPGGNLSTTEFSERLSFMGYTRADSVESRGQFSIRGGIVDIFPLTEEQPYRIELWGDEIDTIRKVNRETHRSTEKVEQLVVFPAREAVIDENAIVKAAAAIGKDMKASMSQLEKAGAQDVLDNLERYGGAILERVEHEGNFNGIEALLSYYFDETVSILDYFDSPIVYLDEPQRLSERLANAMSEFEESMMNRFERGLLFKGQLDMFRDLSDIIKNLEDKTTVMLNTLAHKDAMLHSRHKMEFEVHAIQPYHNSFDMLVKDLEHWKKAGYRMLLLSASRTRAKRVSAMLQDAGLFSYVHEDMETPLTPGNIAVSVGSLHKGYEYPLVKWVLLTETELVGKRRKPKKRKQGRGGIGSFDDLKAGDYVVHENHGVGIFKGIETIEVEGISKDFIKIGYKDNGNLYIATSQLDMLQKYVSAEGKSPKLNKLGTQEWKKTKARVKGAVEEIAEELVELYAKREKGKGYPFSKDTLWQTEFEEVFPYQETDDQLTAIEETKKDMESAKIMDRLICGDVGYGKTEVAIRAAFKAVQDGKQVAYLVPTTILAQQQYNNFAQRMKDFPVNIEVLSRFRTPKEQKTVIEGTNKGKVDIIIGTHRLLSKDMHFKDLGLLIIDEEQRFGVKHKEKIKGLKENIDVLTLTATPIPRTLHMSLIGIRSMSVLEEPPEERHPIQTYVLEQNDEVIKDAIYRELGRDGQVYYVYNRVRNIAEVAAKISALVPEAIVAYAHGQMSERELENVMFDFINGEVDILVATTIIETGLDIPNTNTMIIQDADHMGLSQLYQLRGRVGRSNRVAYAYLMYKRDKILQEVAEKRLKAIKEFTEFGAGFKIAMRDLEIRGAGNLLGARQHGHMDAVGYDLYSKMLASAIKSLGSETVEEAFETAVDFNVDAYIPDSYIDNEVLKIESYKKIAAIASQEDYMDIQDELVDRYGDLPKPVTNLVEIAFIKSLAHEMGMLSVEEKQGKVRFEIKQDAPLNPAGIPELIAKHSPYLQFKVSEMPVFILTVKDDKQVLSNVKNILQDVKALKES